MSRPPRSASFLTHPALTGMLALLATAFSCALLPAQSFAPASAAAPSATKAAPAAKPAAPAPVVPAPAARLDSGPFALVHDQPQTPVLSFGVNAGARQQILSMPDSLHSNPSFGSFVPPVDSAIGFTAARGFTFGRQGVGGLSPFASAAKAGQPIPLFPLIYGPAASPAAGPQGPFASTPWSLYSANGALRGNVKLPLGPPPSSLRFIYKAPPAPSSFFSSLEFRKMINTGMFTSPDLGNGVHLSAGTDYNGKSVAGSHKPSGPTVNIKLTF